MRERQQRGVTTVEFAIVGLWLFALLFGIIELGRIVFTLNVLQEGARRGARVAAVCSVGNSAIADAVTFMPLPGFTAENVAVEYLDEDGVVIGDAAGDGYARIRYVRIRIAGVSFQISIPLIAPQFAVSDVVATLPRESLGVPRWGAPADCY
jgi:hypothetical protein